MIYEIYLSVTDLNTHYRDFHMNEMSYIEITCSLVAMVIGNIRITKIALR